MFPNCWNKWKISWQLDENDDRSLGEVAELIRKFGYEPVWKDWDAALTA
jgi:2-iminoacetate synthase